MTVQPLPSRALEMTDATAPPQTTFIMFSASSAITELWSHNLIILLMSEEMKLLWL